MTTQKIPKVLFLCTGNSCRSQMAEGWTRHLHPDSIHVYSAGIVAHGLNPKAVKVMAEKGVDIARHRSKTLQELEAIEFDLVITVCDNAKELCPIFSGRVRMLHHGFDDPPALENAMGSDQARLEPYRRVRDEIRDFVETLPQRLVS